MKPYEASVKLGEGQHRWGNETAAACQCQAGTGAQHSIVGPSYPRPHSFTFTREVAKILALDMRSSTCSNLHRWASVPKPLSKSSSQVIHGQSQGQALGMAHVRLQNFNQCSSLDRV